MARACWEIGLLNLLLFGRDVVSHAELTGKSSAGLKPFRLVANVSWLPFGLVLAFSHVLHGCIMFVTIIGVPLAIQDLKLAGISRFPVGKRVVTKELMDPSPRGKRPGTTGSLLRLVSFETESHLS